MQRRSFIQKALIAAGGFVGGAVLNAGQRAVSLATGCDIVVTGDVPGGFTIPEGEVWRVQGLVTTDANVIVNGTLQMRPGDTLRFVNVSEASYVGGGMDPVASDVGLWVMGAGRLDLQGTPKVGWNRTGDDSTWLETDELRVAPTARGDFGASGFAAFTKGSTVPQARPDVPKAEVLNLTRDVNIEGTPTGRAHVFIRNTVPTLHTIDSVGFRNLGPRKNGVKVLGRWPLHFHHGMHNNHGQVVRDVVVRDAGSHAFVTHATHGVTYLRCIAYSTQEAAYWWDQDGPADNSNDITYDRCVAARNLPSTLGLYSFILTGGTNNTLRECVAVGNQGGNTTSAGFNWPENGPPGVWTMEDCVAHNNLRRGAYNWRNSETAQPPTTRFTVYRNGHYGVSGGAYRFPMDYVDVVAVDNMVNTADSANFGFSATSGFNAPRGNEIRGLLARDAPIGISITPASAEQVFPDVFVDPVIEDSATPVKMRFGNLVRRYDFVRPMVDGVDAVPPDFTRVNSAPAGSVMRVQRLDDQSAWQMDLQTGAIAEIPPFA